MLESRFQRGPGSRIVYRGDRNSVSARLCTGRAWLSGNACSRTCTASQPTRRSRATICPVPISSSYCCPPARAPPGREFPSPILYLAAYSPPALSMPAMRRKTRPLTRRAVPWPGAASSRPGTRSPPRGLQQPPGGHNRSFQE